jgi:DNA-binding transcriptional MerR regulator
MSAEATYTISELAQAANVTTRTVRYYVAEGLLPPPDSSGRSASYGEEHLERLELIKLLKEEFLPLSEIKSLLEGLDDEAVRELLTQRRPEPPKPEPETAKAYLQTLLDPPKSPSLMRQVVAAKADSGTPSMPQARPAVAGARSGPSAQRSPVAHDGERAETAHEYATIWQRYALHPDIELHVRQTSHEGALNERLDRLILEIRRLIEEYYSKERPRYGEK